MNETQQIDCWSPFSESLLSANIFVLQEILEYCQRHSSSDQSLGVRDVRCGLKCCAFIFGRFRLRNRNLPTPSNGARSPEMEMELKTSDIKSRRRTHYHIVYFQRRWIIHSTPSIDNLVLRRLNSIQQGCGTKSGILLVRIRTWSHLGSKLSH